MIVGDGRGGACTLSDTMRPRVRVLWWRLARELIALGVRVQELSISRVKVHGMSTPRVRVQGVHTQRVRVQVLPISRVKIRGLPTWGVIIH